MFLFKQYFRKFRNSFPYKEKAEAATKITKSRFTSTMPRKRLIFKNNHNHISPFLKKLRWLKEIRTRGLENLVHKCLLYLITALILPTNQTKKSTPWCT